MTTYKLLRWSIALLAPLFFSSPATAIGDSGGCGDSMGGPLGKSVQTGSVADVEREIGRWLDYKERDLGILAKIGRRASGSGATDAWRRQQARNLIEGVHAKDQFCAPGALLPAAANAGNLAVTGFLLNNPMGVDPRVPPNILFSCKNDVLSDAEQRSRRRDAFAMIIDSGAVDIAVTDKRGATALETCLDPQLLALFIARGARTDIERGDGVDRRNLLEQALIDAVQYEEGSYTARRLHGVDRAQLFSNLTTRSIRGRPVEARIRYSCNLRINDKPWNPETCRELARFIDATPGTFGNLER